MPALERSFSEPLPARLYIDTDILLSATVRSEPHHARCADLLRLARQGGTVLYISTLSWLEYAHTVSRERFRQNLPEPIRRRFRLGRWQEAPVRATYLAALIGEFERLLGYYEYEVMPISAQVRDLALTHMARHALGSQDAVHLASAALAGVPDFASLDDAFRRVDGLLLWNDRVHGAGA